MHWLLSPCFSASLCLSLAHTALPTPPLLPPTHVQRPTDQSIYHRSTVSRPTHVLKTLPSPHHPPQGLPSHAHKARTGCSTASPPLRPRPRPRPRSPRPRRPRLRNRGHAELSSPFLLLLLVLLVSAAEVLAPLFRFPAASPLRQGRWCLRRRRRRCCRRGGGVGGGRRTWCAERFRRRPRCR